MEKKKHIVKPHTNSLSIVFLVDNAEEAKKLSELMDKHPHIEWAVISGIKVIYRKSDWEILEI